MSNESTPATGPARRNERGLCLPLSILPAFATLLLACGGGDDLPWEAQRASEVRELDFLRDVEVVRMTRAEFRARAEDNADAIDDADLRAFADTYGRLGFFPLDVDLRPVLAGSSDWVGASYSARTETITLVEDNPGDVSASTQVHEWVHALQDQHFDLATYNDSTSRDQYLALQAVVEGDALLAQLRFDAQEEHDGEVDGWNWPRTLDNWQAFTDDLLSTASYPIFLAYPSFVYRFGLGYTATNLLGADFSAPSPHDWGREDELFTERPPATTQEVIRRNIGVDPVELVGLDAVPPALDGRLDTDTWDTLGEWHVYLLFYPPAGSANARQMAAAWDGDRVLFVRDAMRGGAAATVWASVWDDQTAANQVVTALDALYGRSADAEVPQAGTAYDGEALWIEQRENRVVAIKNLDPELAPAMAEAAFAPPTSRSSLRPHPPLEWLLREVVY